MIQNLDEIKVGFDFTSDVPGYWDGYWETSPWGWSGKDPDSKSPTLRRYHQLLWSKMLPNGEQMKLVDGRGKFYLRWKDFYFGSDSIIVSFRHSDKNDVLDDVRQRVPDFRTYIENYVRASYTIGGMMLFPQHKYSFNCARGCNKRICDRWDLTLECIRRFYQGGESPLTKALERDREFFELFVDFKGYVDFFFLQDCVDKKYERVNLWLGEDFFEKNPYPHNADEYLMWIKKQCNFLQKRNKRIDNFIHERTHRMIEIIKNKI